MAWPGKGFDPQYFQRVNWTQRAANWKSGNDEVFLEGNRHVIEQAITSPDSGLRAVINIGVHALVSFLTEGQYRNLYEKPEIGGDPPKEATAQRVEVDTEFGLDEHTYFAAVALGGVGVRYYGEYCMVLDVEMIDPDPQLFDRDSYDILLEPFAGNPHRTELVEWLTGRWSQDLHAMVSMKVMPELIHQRRLVTTGTVSEAVLKDQEFIEVHIDPRRSGRSGSFAPVNVLEVRQSPDEVAVAMRLDDLESSGRRLSDVEHEWLVRREAAERALADAKKRTRVVTSHGQGYQWA